MYFKGLSPLKFFLQAIKEDNAASQRVLKAYKMMLDFYGMELVSDITGTVQRCKKNWKERYKHLNKYVCAFSYTLLVTVMDLQSK